MSDALAPDPVFRQAVPRPDPPATADEFTAISAWLDWHRATLLTKLDGVTDAQLRWSPVPSGTSLLGLVRHLTDTEHGWFINEWGQSSEPAPYETDDDPDVAWRVPADQTADAAVSGYLAACARSREAVAGRSLDETVPNRRRGTIDLRRIMVHMLEETARHNGHADLLRELIDGTTGD